MTMPVIKCIAAADYLGLLPCSDACQHEHRIGLSLKVGNIAFTRQWLGVRSDDNCGTAMVHVRDAVLSDMREVLIKATSWLQPLRPLKYIILLEYPKQDPGLELLYALPDLWTIDETRSMPTTIRGKIGPSDSIIVAFFDEERTEIRCAFIQ
ncbi:hypothetical protein PSPO01_11340 [Paraphaeosphaeria sporulosa]